MQEKGELRAAPARGDFRTGAGLAAAGILLLAATQTPIWADTPIVPGALATALMVFGGYLLSIRAGLLAGGGADRRFGIGHFESHTEPVFISDLKGRLLAANPAARLASPADAGLDAGAARYRLTREAR